MGVHMAKKNFLHSKEAHNYAGICRDLTEDQAEALFAQLRWGSETEQACPDCGTFRRHYRRNGKRRWRCADCGHEFSATSRTAFHARKLSYRRLIGLLLFFESGAKGRSLAESARELGVQIKTAQINFGKIRETLVNSMDLTPLQGIVHMDGIYLGGKPRRPNRRTKMPKDALKVRYGKKPPNDPSKPWVSAGMTRRNWRKRMKKRVVISICQTGDKGAGSERVMAFVCRAENEANVIALAQRFIQRGSLVMSDESPAYNRLGSWFEHYSVQHSHEYSTDEGVNNNAAESWNSRIRRHEYGVSHGFRPKYIQDYACEMVWRENFRRACQRSRVHALLKSMVQSPRSTWWRGYFQGNHRETELDIDYFLGRDSLVPA
ncbi:ISXO2-like transposase domain protein [Xanthomonas fragariae]|uniref:ISXO2-like transposase domain protein n=2 Tax=Xanthomonas fragariae TaxID=48664 RepID=A0ABY1RKJ0_9XANT|nr:ISXO2-like transposase domain protein [Xanthomonas fragariae]